MPEAAAPVCQKASIALPHRRSDEKTERRGSYRTIQLAYEARAIVIVHEFVCKHGLG